METDFPTVELFFVFAFTYCKVKVYKQNEAFARNILEANDVEFLERSESNDWQEVDTRLLLDLVGLALTKLLPSMLQQPEVVAKQMEVRLGIRQ